MARAAALLAEQARAGGLALLVSPLASLEDVLVTLAVAREGLGLSQVFVGGRPDGWQDDFLKRADENPNRRGLELAAGAFGMAVRPFADLLAEVAGGHGARRSGRWATELPVEGAAAKLAALDRASPRP